MTGVRLGVVADHYQVCLLDDEAFYHALQVGHPTDAGNEWAYNPLAFNRIGVDTHLISIGTARDDLVEFVVEICASPPPSHVTAEHIVEADLAVQSGAIHLRGCTEDPTPDRRIGLDAGLFGCGSRTCRQTHRHRS